jgi:hypothetical protein
MSLSPETLELVARGLGLNSLSFLRMDHIEESIYTDFPDNTVAYSLPDLAAACKAKLRERGVGFESGLSPLGRAYARLWRIASDCESVGLDHWDARRPDTDDLALILAFSQAVAKGALP